VLGLSAGLWALGSQHAQTTQTLAQTRDDLEEARSAAEQPRSELRRVKADLDRARDERRRADAAVLRATLRLENVRTERDRARTDLARVSADLGRTQANLKLARQSVDDCFDAARDHPVFQAEETEKAKKLLLEKTLPFYRKFRSQLPEGPARQREEAQRLVRQASGESLLERSREAVLAYQQARDIQTRLAKEHPEERRNRHELARTHFALGRLLADLKKRDEAVKEYTKARDLQVQLAIDNPDDLQYEKELTLTRNNLKRLLNRSPGVMVVSSRQVVRAATNDFPGWMVRVSVDREDRTYRIGDEVKVKVKSEKGGYLYLFNVDAGDEVFLLYPNGFQRDNRIDAKTEVTVPDPKDSKFKTTISEPVGKELLRAIVTRKPLETLQKRVQKLKPGEPLQLKKEEFGRLTVEAMHLEPEGGSVDEIKEEAREQFFSRFQKEAKEWAEHTIDLVTLKKNAERPAPQRVGLFVGISKYRSESIRALKCARADAIKMAQVMKDRCGLARTVVLTDARATRAAVEKTFREDLVEKTRPGDLVVVYWSGHGGHCASTDRKEPDAYLVPHDGSLESPLEERKTMLLDRTLGRWVQALDGRKVVVIIDTGVTGPLDSKPGTDKTLGYTRGLGRLPWRQAVKWTGRHFLETELVRSKAIGQRSTAVLTAATVKQPAFERREGDLGVLTYYLVEKLQQGKGPLTLKQLADHVRPRVSKYVEDEFAGVAQDVAFSDQGVDPPAAVRK
jgi:tetratricopeptide (TPR) repeat protein